MIRAALLALALAAPALAGAAERVAYFKSEDRARVIAYQGAEGEAEARAILERATVTEGRAALLLFYPPEAEAPGDALTLAPDLAAAMRVAAGFPDWRYRLRINPAGMRTFDKQ